MKKVKLAVFVSALLGTSVVFAQQTPPAKPATPSTQTAQTAQQPRSAATGQTRGGMSAGAGQTSAAVVEGAVTTEGLVGLGAALVVTTTAVATGNKH
jgi:hypothetical protein